MNASSILETPQEAASVETVGTVEPTETVEQAPAVDFGGKLRSETTAVKLELERFGAKRSLSKEQRGQAAESFGAKRDRLSAGKELVKTTEAKYKACSSALSAARAVWVAYSHPFPERGIRLIRRERVQAFEDKMADCQALLDKAVAELDAHWSSLVEQARADLGALFNAADYPDSVSGEFKIDWSYPVVGVPEHLKHVSPALYAAQCKRVEQQFSAAIALFEQQMAAELGKMVAHICERLTGTDEDGNKKGFHKSSVENIKGFFERFKTLSTGSNAELEAVVAQAQAAVEGLDVKDLKTNDGLRDSVKSQLSAVQEALDSMLVDKPSRAFYADDDGTEVAETPADEAAAL